MSSYTCLLASVTESTDSLIIYLFIFSNAYNIADFMILVYHFDNSHKKKRMDIKIHHLFTIAATSLAVVSD